MSFPCNPTPPPNFQTILPSNLDGYYILGYPDFRVRPLKVANIFHRSFGGAQEDLILGTLCIVLIALLTEICHVILLRSSKRQVSRGGFHTAFVLDEITHFRNVFSHIRSRSASRVSRKLMWSSLMVLALGAVLIAAEVFAVYITQPFKVYTPADRYNLRGIQPVQTTDQAARDIDKLTAKKRCVSPMMPNSTSSREFSIFACVNRSTASTMKDINSKTTFVEISSWFHKAGSDHNIAYGNEDTNETGTHDISTRASIMLSDKGLSSGIMFDFNQTAIVPQARYLHRKAIQAAIQTSCDLFKVDDCDKLFEQCNIGGHTEESPLKHVTLWEVEKDGTEEPVTEIVKGIVTRFQVNISAPYISLKDSFRVFATSAAIQEVVDGQGMYVSMPYGEEYVTMEGLASEEGRIAGVFLLSLILLLMFGLLIFLRLIFKPISMARLARDSLDMREEEPDFIDDEECIGPRPQINQQSVWALERDIVEPDLDDYGSTDMFDLPRDPPPKPKRGFWRRHDRGPD